MDALLPALAVTIVVVRRTKIGDTFTGRLAGDVHRVRALDFTTRNVRDPEWLVQRSDCEQVSYVTLFGRCDALVAPSGICAVARFENP